MDINRLTSLEVLADYHQNNQRLVQTTERLSTQSRASTPRQDPILWGDIQQLGQFAETLSGLSDNLNRGAASVRIALDSMEASRQHLLQLEERLNAAFAESPGSEERAKALREYNQLHRYLNDTARAPDAGARRLLDDPAAFPEAGDVEIRAGEDGFTLTLRSQEIHTGATGLDLPRAGEAVPSELAADPAALPVIDDINNASNAEIGEMIGYLERAKADLTAKGKALAVDATAIDDSERFNEALILRNRNQAEAIGMPDLNAEAILANSISLQNSLALSGIAGLKDTYRLALQLMQ
jgi:flagellin-like hook-associated protein FlgL